MTVRPCTSSPTQLGDFPSGQRVNYAYGMVLGVDDFRQEQVHHVRRRRLDNRMLHGFGVAYGLEVDPTPVSGDLELAIGAGMAVDPLGRELVVGERQCLRLNDWLDANRAAVTPRLDENRLRLCVTIRYRECLERPVPVPGVPCATEEENRAHSRIREGYRLQLELDEPTQLPEEVTRRFGDLLQRVEVDPTLDDASSDEDDLIRHVELLGTEGEPDSAGVWYRLPLEGARAAVRRIFRTWTAQVRPRLVALEEPVPTSSNGNGTQPSEPPVLLGCVTITLDAAGRYVDGSIRLDSESRPVLLETRAIQELLQSWTALLRRDVREFASLYADESDLIRIWLHHEEPLILTPASIELRVTSAAGTIGVAAIQDDPADPRVKVIRTSSPIPMDAWVGVGFRMDEITVGGTARTLGEVVDEERLSYASRYDRTLWAYTAFEGATPARRFVSVRCVSKRALELWFHTDLPLKFRADGALLVRKSGQTLSPKKDPVWQPVGEQDRSFVWHVPLADDDPPFEDGEEIELNFDSAQIIHDESGNKQLNTWIRQTETTFVGADGETIRTTHVLSCPTVEQVKPTLSFVDLCLVEDGLLRAWIHFDLPLELQNESEKPTVTVRVNGDEVDLLSITLVDDDQNVFDIRFSPPGAGLDHGDRVEVEFHTDRIRVREMGPLGVVRNLLKMGDLFRRSVPVVSDASAAEVGLHAFTRVEGVEHAILPIAPAGVSTGPVAVEAPTPADGGVGELPARPAAVAEMDEATRRALESREISSAETAAIHTLGRAASDALTLAKLDRRTTLETLLGRLPYAYADRVGSSLFGYLLHCCCGSHVCTLGIVDARDPRTVRIRFHTSPDEPLAYDPNVKTLMLRIGTGTLYRSLQPTYGDGDADLSHTWTIALPEAEKDLSGGEVITVGLDTRHIFAGELKQPLYGLLKERGESLVCEHDGRVMLRGVADLALGLPKEPEPAPVPLPRLPSEYAKIRPMPSREQGEGLRFLAAILPVSEKERLATETIAPRVQLAVDDGQSAQRVRFPLVVEPALATDGNRRQNMLDLLLEPQGAKIVLLLMSELGPLLLRFEFFSESFELPERVVEVSRFTEIVRPIAELTDITRPQDQTLFAHAHLLVGLDDLKSQLG